MKPDPETLDYGSTTASDQTNTGGSFVRAFSIMMLLISISSTIAIPLVRNRADDPLKDGVYVAALFVAVFLFAGLSLWIGWEFKRFRRVVQWVAVLNVIGAFFVTFRL